MDLAYDHIQEESFPKDNSDEGSGNDAGSSAKSEQHATLNSDLQEAYRAISASPWGSRIGGFFGSVVKQVGLLFEGLPLVGMHPQ